MSTPRPSWSRWHRHRWTKWAELRGVSSVRDVRHCTVCNRRQVRIP